MDFPAANRYNPAMAEIEGKYVILRHKTHQDTHFDLMLEQPETLKTWQFKEFPAANTSATLIAPHRKAYLEYEGPISNDRGHVTRVDEGIFSAEISDTQWLIKFQGKKLNGNFCLQKQNAHWKLTSL